MGKHVFYFNHSSFYDFLNVCFPQKTSYMSPCLLSFNINIHNTVTHSVTITLFTPYFPSRKLPEIADNNKEGQHGGFYICVKS